MRRSYYFSMRLSEDEARELDEKTVAAGFGTRAEYVRAVLLGECPHRYVGAERRCLICLGFESEPDGVEGSNAFG